MNFSEKKIGNILNTLKKEYTGFTMLGSFTNKSAFQILIATALSARTKDSTTIKVVKVLFEKYPDVFSLSKANIKDIEKIIKKTGFYRIKAKRIVDISNYLIENYKGVVPQTMEELIKLPGVGRKTAGCVLVYAFDKDAIPVDTHVHRISNRIGFVKTKKPEDTEIELIKLIPKKYWKMLNEVLVLHGQNNCFPINPNCNKCKIEKYCNKNNV
jgi:endonuclease III